MWNEIKVIELASVLAGPAVGMFFAELGATVIKVENHSGDMTRKWKLPVEKDKSISAYFSSINYNKEYLTLDLSDPEQKETILEEIKSAQIVISNFKPSSAKKLGIDYESIKQIQPQIIYGEITGFNNSKRTAFDVVLQAETGWMSMNGTPNSGPVKMPVALIDVLAAHQLKEGILTAMLQQQKSKLPYKISVSLYDSAISSLVNQASNYLMNQFIPKRIGSAHPNIAPYGDLFTTKDGKHLVLAVGTDHHFKILCELLNLPENSNFVTNPQRVIHRTKLIDSLSDKINEHNSEELMNKLLERNIPAGIVKDLKAVLDSPDAQHLILDDNIEHQFTRRVKSKVFKISS